MIDALYVAEGVVCHLLKLGKTYCTKRIVHNPQGVYTHTLYLPTMTEAEWAITRMALIMGIRNNGYTGIINEKNNTLSWVVRDNSKESI